MIYESEEWNGPGGVALAKEPIFLSFSAAFSPQADDEEEIAFKASYIFSAPSFPSKGFAREDILIENWVDIERGT